MATVQTIRCPKCGRENRSGAKFCVGCGTALPQPVREPKPEEKAHPSALALPKEEAAEVARKLWDLSKTVITVGGRTAWNELTNPPATLEGKVTDELTVDAVTPPVETALWGFIGWSFVLLVFGLSGSWIIPLISTVATLVASWLRWRRPYFSPLGWRRLPGFGKNVQVPSLNLKLQTDKGEVQVALFGEQQGDKPKEGEQVRLWGIFDDEPQTQLRAWKVQALDDSGQPKGQPLIVPRLFPLAPSLFFASLGSFVLAVLINWLK